jgi:hypothetical protein
MNGIFDDNNPRYNPFPSLLWTKLLPPQAMMRGSIARLYVPNRGILQVYPGDWIAIDAQGGWPILVTRNVLPQTRTATGNTSNLNAVLASLSTNVLALGWSAGMPISGTGVSAGAIIGSIASNGLSLNMVNSSNAPLNGASVQTGTTVTAGTNWVHS